MKVKNGLKICRQTINFTKKVDNNKKIETHLKINN